MILLVLSPFCGRLTTRIRFDSLSAAATHSSASFQVSDDFEPPRAPFIGDLMRSGSYKLKTHACPRAQRPPLFEGCKSLPSILIGRPSRVFTSVPQAFEQSLQVDA